MSSPTNYNGFLNQPRNAAIQEEAFQIGSREYGLKFKSARENWRFFHIDSMKYAPPFSCWKQNYARELLAGTKL